MPVSLRRLFTSRDIIVRELLPNVFSIEANGKRVIVSAEYGASEAVEMIKAGARHRVAYDVARRLGLVVEDYGSGVVGRVVDVEGDTWYATEVLLAVGDVVVRDVSSKHYEAGEKVPLVYM